MSHTGPFDRGAVAAHLHTHQPRDDKESAVASTDLIEQCDHPQCPARAQRVVFIYGADFYFCTHHAEELAPQLAGVPSEPLPQKVDSTPGTAGSASHTPPESRVGTSRGWLRSR